MYVRSSGRWMWLFVRLFSLVALVAVILPASFASAQPARPNILIIMTDDQRYDTMEYMPRTKARIFDQGITFNNAYVTTPLCCPSRASTLTGLYAHNHGVRDNGYRLNDSTVVDALHENGYYTGLVGKYLGYWQGTPRPEFDYWVSFKGTTSPYFDPDLNVNGKQGVVPGYITYLFRDYALDFLDQAADQSKPFALIVTPNAPHDPAEPAPEDEDLYPNLAPLRSPSFDEDDLSDKSLYMQSIATLDKKEIAESDKNRRKQLQSLSAVDRMVNKILTKLEDQGQLDNTFVLFMSDNGYMWGEHGRTMKKMPYEESVKVPFAVRYPPLTSSARTEKGVVANIDIAPTLYELAGVEQPYQMDGRSIMPLLSDDSSQSAASTVVPIFANSDEQDGGFLSDQPTSVEWDRHVMLEAWNSRPWRALRYDRYIYIDWSWDRAELYDLEADPYQLNNIADDPANAALVADLKQRLAQDAEKLMPGDDASYRVRYDGWSPIAPTTDAETGAFSTDKATETLTYRSPIASSSIGFITRRGPDMGKAVVTVDGQSKGTLDLYAAEAESDVVYTYDDLRLKSHTITVRVLGKQNRESSGKTVVVEGFEVDGVRLAADNPEATVSDWDMSTDSGMDVVGGSFHRSDRSGATATFTFSGTQATWLTSLGPKLGKVLVLVDGEDYTTVDLYGKKREWQHPVVIDGLTDGEHTVTIKVLGKKNPASGGKMVIFDAYSVP